MVRRTGHRNKSEKLLIENTVEIACLLRLGGFVSVILQCLDWFSVWISVSKKGIYTEKVIIYKNAAVFYLFCQFLSFGYRG